MSIFRGRFARPTSRSQMSPFFTKNVHFGRFRKSILKFLQYFWKIFIKKIFFRKNKVESRKSQKIFAKLTKILAKKHWSQHHQMLSPIAKSPGNTREHHLVPPGGGEHKFSLGGWFFLLSSIQQPRSVPPTTCRRGR